MVYNMDSDIDGKLLGKFSHCPLCTILCILLSLDSYLLGISTSDQSGSNPVSSSSKSSIVSFFFFADLPCSFCKNILKLIYVAKYRAPLIGGPQVACEAEVVKKSRNKIHQTWGLPVSGAL